MITRDDYFVWQSEEKQHPAEHEANFEAMIKKVNFALYTAHQEHPSYDLLTCPNTGTLISGSHAGHGDGGYRLPDTVTGAAHSNHRTGHAVDVYDPHGELDEYMTDQQLERFGLYREHPLKTPGWCHLQDVPPGSGHRTYFP